MVNIDRILLVDVHLEELVMGAASEVLVAVGRWKEASQK